MDLMGAEGPGGRGGGGGSRCRELTYLLAATCVTPPIKKNLLMTRMEIWTWALARRVDVRWSYAGESVMKGG